MSKITRVLLTFFIFFAALNFVQAQSAIDSLEAALAKKPSDSIAFLLLKGLSVQYEFINFAKAEDYADKSLAVAEKHNWDWAKKQTYPEIARLAEITGNYTKALKYAGLLLQTARATGDSSALFRAFIHYGYDYNDLGEFDEAYFNFSQALQIALKHKDSLNISIALLDIGSVYKSLGEYDTAIAYLNRADQMSILVKDYVGKAFYLDELGDVYIKKGDYAKAETSLLTGIRISRKYNDTWLESRMLAKLGHLYYFKNQLIKADLYYDSAASISKKTDNDYGLADNNLGKGEVLMAQGKYKEAEVLVQESLKTAKILHARKMESDCFDQLSQIAEKEQDYKKALGYYRNFKILSDSLFGQEMLEKLFQNQMRAEIRSKDFQIASLSEAKNNRDSEIRKQEFIRNILVVVLALTAILLFTIYRSGQRRIKINKLLLEHQEDIKRRSVELEQLNEVKDKFFSIISHDLRSPINALSGILNLLEKQSLSPQEFASLTTELRVQFNSTKTLINNLLDWALLQMDKLKTQPETIEVRSLVDENFRMLGSYHLKDVEFNNEIPATTRVVADLNMVNLVFRNLILNAIKFTESGGKITVSAKESDTFYTLSVADNGVGISPEVQHLLFEKTTGYSTRGTANEKGTGLGLILCKEFVEKNGGKIWMDSEIGKGSTFHFTLKKA